jgi:hypothetical protein
MKKDGATRERQRKYWRDSRNTHYSRLVLRRGGWPNGRVLQESGENLTQKGRWTTKWGGLASSRLRWRLHGVSFKGRIRGDGGGARTENDDRRARHTSAEAARRALINPTAHMRQTLLWINSVLCDE